MTEHKTSKNKFYIMVVIALLCVIFIMGIALGLGVSFIGE
jgi:uncharacterized membrane protein YsdA (DUF1294 family)